MQSNRLDLRSQSNFAVSFLLSLCRDSMSDDEDSVLWEEEIPRSIFDCQHISKDTSNNTWHCGHCGKTYAIIHATKAVKHLAAIPGVIVPPSHRCKRRCTKWTKATRAL